MHSIQEPPDGIIIPRPSNTFDSVNASARDNEQPPLEIPSHQHDGMNDTGLGISAVSNLTESNRLNGSTEDGVLNGSTKQSSKRKGADTECGEDDRNVKPPQTSFNHPPNKSNGNSNSEGIMRYDDNTNMKAPSNTPDMSDHLQELTENHFRGGRVVRNSDTPMETLAEEEKEKVSKKLSPSQIHELTSSPEFLSLRPFPQSDLLNTHLGSATILEAPSNVPDQERILRRRASGRDRSNSEVAQSTNSKVEIRSPPTSFNSPPQDQNHVIGGLNGRPLLSSRTVSTPPSARRSYSSNKPHSASRPDTTTPKSRRDPPTPLPLDAPTLTGRKITGVKGPISPDPAPSPMPQSIPLPPLSMPTYLQLELSSSRPSPLYIHRSATSDFPYESSRVKFERLQNFLLLPPNLEGVLWFGALACLDAWLYSFTILPLRFIKAIAVLSRWWGQNILRETQDIASFIYSGLGRMWHRPRFGIDSAPASSIHTPVAPLSRKNSDTFDADQQLKPSASLSNDSSAPQSYSDQDRKRKRASTKRHRRTKSIPSALLPSHKADLLKGLVVLFSCIILTRFDASRMYHGIRGQAAIKLYVIYNVLEVCDRLFSALGQDVFECLFSRETLDRKPDGRSKILRPFGMFVLALTYNVIHSTALFYQVITLNVAVNSYSNALLTLLMSNQFVEIKSTVFKKFEKENLFQLTCADVVERFQLWLMLMIIALRNLVEVGLPVLGMGLGSSSISSFGANVGASLRTGVLPKSFTMFPEWTGQLFGPFFLVLGSEMLVDWLKHAYITKFNNTKPAIYGRFLDVLAKDYYSNAFADQNLTRRLGLPVIPLSCLFIRASLQTYHMFLATHVPLPIPSTATSLSDSAETSPSTTAALQHVDAIIRRALGRSSFGAGGGESSSSTWWNLDDFIAFAMLVLVLMIAFLALLAIKLVLGMLLLSFARRRYKGMKEREKEIVDTAGRRIGGWGVVEVDEDKKRWIYQDDPAGAQASKEREKATRERAGKSDGNFGGVSRYTMIAKRIW